VTWTITPDRWASLIGKRRDPAGRPEKIQIEARLPFAVVQHGKATRRRR